MSNILQAILNIYHCPTYDLTKQRPTHNRMNDRGISLERFVKDAFSNTYGYDEEDAQKVYSGTFSYLGNQNNPPDMILKNSDAIEVKKIESIHADIALNSSYPKTKLYRESTMLTNSCKACEGGTWDEKDLIFSVGVVHDNRICDFCFVYGDTYAADSDIYERIRNTIKEGILCIPDVDFAETRELGRVNKVDPLGITYLRMRGMWHIENPFRVFHYVYNRNEEKDFHFFAVINENKYMSFPIHDRKSLEAESDILIRRCGVKNPNNPALIKDVVVITFER